MKILALYLPQFHRVQENDEWWGEGFTEWTSVKKAIPLFEGHRQPKIPLGGMYYDLLEYDTMQNQEKLMKKYGIDGICIYHYWFDNGRKILEKPAENLLKWKELDIPYCFAWANETWARTWSNLIDVNSWTTISEQKKDVEGTGVLLEQRYGEKDAWKIHFDYLLDFFMDKRYIRVDNKPVVVFYKTKDIYCFENMVEYWNELAVANGLEGIYVIGNDVKKSQLASVDEMFISEPGDAMKKCIPYKKNGVACYDYDDVWNVILNSSFENASIGAFVNYDDTPRKGIKGSVIEGGNPEKFMYYLRKIIHKNCYHNHNIMFINAWNEWGEGMYLEPDEHTKYEYLNSVKKCVGEDFCISSDELENKTLSQLIQYNFEEGYEKEKELRIILDTWMSLREKGKYIVDIYDTIRNKRIAIYGYGILGRHLIDDLSKSGIKPEFVIDRDLNKSCAFDIISPDDEWPIVDIIIVSATYDYGYIYHRIREKEYTCEVVSLGHILMGY